LQKAVSDGEATFAEEPQWGMDLSPVHQQYLCEEHYKQAIVITDHPKELKTFYMRLNNGMKTVASAEIIVPTIGELIGGSERESRLDLLKERCKGLGLDPQEFSWYLDLRRYGTVPHAGFGVVFERLLLFIAGLDDVRDVAPFPRWAGHCSV
jgi:asparaginyl-tRNA synthetase